MEEKNSQIFKLIGKCCLTAAIVLGNAMIIVGSLFYGECELEASLFLIVVGSTILGCIILSGLIIWCFGGGSDESKAIMVLCHLCLFCICIGTALAELIWGSVVVFGTHKDWDNVNRESDMYCHTGPYMFAFVLIIIFWVFFVLTLTTVGLFCCGVIAVLKDKESQDHMERYPGLRGHIDRKIVPRARTPSPIRIIGPTSKGPQSPIRTISLVRPDSPPTMVQNRLIPIYPPTPPGQPSGNRNRAPSALIHLRQELSNPSPGIIRVNRHANIIPLNPALLPD